MEDINIKKCSHCKQKKPFSEFNKCKRNKYGLHNHCRECQKKIKARWDKENKEWIKEYSSSTEIREKQKNKQKERYHNDLNYREKILRLNRIRRRQEPAKITARKYERMRIQTDINYKLGKILRGRVREVIQKIKIELNINISKCASTIELLGCSLCELKTHLEKQFQPGMTWENHGFGDNKWHIDHIKPIDSFDLTQEIEQRKCFHYSNLQPLWQKDNLSKGNKLI